MAIKKQWSSEAAILGTGAGVGLVQAYLTRDVLDAMLGPIPVLSDYLGVWGTWSTMGNILIGGTAFFLAGFTGAIKNQKLRFFLQGYGFTTLLGGLFNGIFPNYLAAQRINAKRAGMRAAGLGRQPIRPGPVYNAARIVVSNGVQSGGSRVIWA